MSDEVHRQISEAVELVRVYSPEYLLRYRLLGCGWVILVIPFIFSVFLAFASPWPGILVAAPIALLFLGCIVGSERIRMDARSRKDNERRTSLEVMNAIHQKVDDLRSQLKKQYENPARLASVEIDFFISHATEDKNSFVRPLADRLKQLGCSVFYDEYSLDCGDSLRESIEEGLRAAKYGVVVLSKRFKDKTWAGLELSALLSLEIAGKLRILPIWHEVTTKEVLEISPLLADKLALKSATSSINEIADDLIALLRRDGR